MRADPEADLRQAFVNNDVSTAGPSSGAESARARRGQRVM